MVACEVICDILNTSNHLECASTTIINMGLQHLCKHLTLTMELPWMQQNLSWYFTLLADRVHFSNIVLAT